MDVQYGNICMILSLNRHILRKFQEEYVCYYSTVIETKSSQ